MTSIQRMESDGLYIDFLSTLHTFPLRVMAHVRIDQNTLPLNHIFVLLTCHTNSLSESILYWPVITIPNMTKSSSPRVKHLSHNWQGRFGYNRTYMFLTCFIGGVFSWQLGLRIVWWGWGVRSGCALYVCCDGQ